MSIDIKTGRHRTIDKGHGRIEERTYYRSTDINWMDARKDWEKMSGIGMVIRRVEERGKKTKERAFYFGSVKTGDYGGFRKLELP